jgi:hypothetical protein
VVEPFPGPYASGSYVHRAALLVMFLESLIEATMVAELYKKSTHVHQQNVWVLQHHSKLFDEWYIQIQLGTLIKSISKSKIYPCKWSTFCRRAASCPRHSTTITFSLLLCHMCFIVLWESKEKTKKHVISISLDLFHKIWISLCRCDIKYDRADKKWIVDYYSLHDMLDGEWGRCLTLKSMMVSFIRR